MVSCMILTYVFVGCSTPVLCIPVTCWDAAAGASLPPQQPPAWEAGGGMGKPKINPSSHSHPLLQLQCCPSLPCGKLLGLLTSNSVTFLLLNEHSGSESPAFLGTAAWERHCPGSQQGQGQGWSSCLAQPPSIQGLECPAASGAVGPLLQADSR